MLASFTVRRTSKRRFGRAKPVMVIVGIAHAELSRDVGAHLGRRRRGEREDRRLAEPRDDGAEREVVGTEVVPPLAHAVRLVDDEQAHGAREQSIEEVAVLEPLRREIEDLALALLDLPRRLARLAASERCECMASASTPCACSLSCWSFISAMSGLTTTVSPGSSSAGSW